MTRYVTTEIFPYAPGKFLPAETTFVPAELGLSEQEVGRWTGVYILSEKEFSRQNNPTAFQAQTELEQANLRIQELTAQLQQVQDPARQSELEQAKAALVQEQQRADELALRLADLPDPTPLLNLFLNEDGSQPTFEQAVEAARQAQADAQASLDDEDSKALAEYREVVGQLYPEGLAPQALNALKEKGWGGKELLSRIGDAQLLDLKGFADTSLKTVRAWAPAQQ
ncbi:hypothetical protein [Deinococcus wulumuqiensis]|uniref:hypothetical protein n=1 Tax=Deinococcus wulumuqiensis TaxID=980427 RepID=UPI00242EECA9|nr:hypothetical protein [Deinococcus wulumuqiensis]